MTSTNWPGDFRRENMKELQLAQAHCESAGSRKGLTPGQDQGRIWGSAVGETKLSILRSGLKL